MSQNHDILDRIEIASPCTQDWNAMTGDEKRRFCGECRLHVHDLSAMTRQEAEGLLRQGDGRVCVRLWRRPDGRVLTQDCVTVRDRLRRRVRRLRVAASALLAFLAPFVGGCADADPTPNDGDGGVIVVEDDLQIMGEICIPDTEPAPGDPRPELGRVKLPERDDTTTDE